MINQTKATIRKSGDWWVVSLGTMRIPKPTWGLAIQWVLSLAAYRQACQLSTRRESALVAPLNSRESRSIQANP